MAKCFIIGGGLAGLSTAVHLAKSGYKVELIEASSKLGGRSHSYLDKHTRTEIDNGQHIMMGAYESTFKFLKIIDAIHIPEFQKKLKIHFIDKKQKRFSLNADKGFYPFNLLLALLKFEVWNFSEKIKAIRLIVSLPFVDTIKLKNITIFDWLKLKNQSGNSIKTLWEVIGVGALNTKLSEAPANIFVSLLKKMFFKGNKSATMVLTKVPLSRLFVEPTKNFFAKNNIQFSLSEKIEKVEIENNKIVKIISDKRTIEDFDKIIFAIPPNSIKKIKSKQIIIKNDLMDYEFSPIITIHFWTKQKLFEEKFIGLFNSEIHWIFNNNTHYSIVISAADSLLKVKSKELLSYIYNELKSFFPKFNSDEVFSYRIIKEKRATLKCNFQNEKKRRELATDISNLYFTGDWTNTKLPSTIEGAILSGERVAKEIISKKNIISVQDI